MAATQAKSEVYFDFYESGSFFVSPIWVQATKYAAASTEEKFRLVGTFPAFERRRRILKAFDITQLRFLAPDHAPLDALWPERLDISDWEPVLEDFARSPADEFVIPAISENALRTLQKVAKRQSLNLNIQDVRTAYVKKLQPELSEDKFIATFSQSTRSVIRRGLRSTLRAVLPDSKSEAHKLLAQLFAMHQAHWQNKNERGAFSNEAVKRFHQDLLERCYEQGNIFLLALKEGEVVCGIVYCLVYNGVAYQYQSARTLTNAAPSLGITLHFRAMQILRGQGVRAYDFLVGSNQLKNSLSDQTEELFWVTLAKQRPLLRIEHFLRLTKRRILSYCKKK